MPSARMIVGVMTGTSVDGVEAAAVRVVGRGLEIEAAVVECVSISLGEIAEPLRLFTQGKALRAHEMAWLRQGLGARCAEAVERAAKRVGRLDLVAAHGQTMHHAPPMSWQALDPWPIALAAGCPVLHDLRGADLARGGEGAPITPIADWVLFRGAEETRAIINLGGFCNATILPAGATLAEIRGFDVCACNHALDAASRRALDAPFDEDGGVALSGEPNGPAVEALRAGLEAQRGEGRSLGSADAALAWVEHWAERLTPVALLASAVEGVATTISAAVAPFRPARALLAGGSVRNRALTGAIARSLISVEVESTASHGVPPAHREAVAMAVLGALCQDGVDVTLPHITGARTTPALFAGSWTNLPPICAPPCDPTAPPCAQ